MITTGELSADDRQRINTFFSLIKAMYGKARFESSWDSQDELRLAKRFWSADILKHSDAELERKIAFAKSQMHLKAWRFPDIALILKADKPTGGQSGQAAMSYKSVDEVLGPVPKRIAAPPSQANDDPQIARMRALLS